MNRPKFLSFHNGIELRVEQIGPDLWVGSVYLGVTLADTPWWETFTALTEDAAMHGTRATAKARGGLGADEPWRNLSDIRDEDWAKALATRGLPGYPERDGMERWDGF